MRVMGIRVVDGSGAPLRPVRAVVRLGGTALCVLTWGAGFLLVLVDDRRRGLQDVVAGRPWCATATPACRAPRRRSRGAPGLRDRAPPPWACTLRTDSHAPLRPPPTAATLA